MSRPVGKHQTLLSGVSRSPPQMAVVQRAAPVNYIFRIREGDDTNDHGDVEDDR